MDNSYSASAVRTLCHITKIKKTYHKISSSLCKLLGLNTPQIWVYFHNFQRK